MIDAMATDLAAHVNEELERSGARSVEDIRRQGRALAAFGPEMNDLVRELKQIMSDRLYRHYRVSRMTEKAGRVLVQLFEAYMREPRQIPPHVLARVETDGEPVARVIADYHRRDDRSLRVGRIRQTLRSQRARIAGNGRPLCT